MSKPATTLWARASAGDMEAAAELVTEHYERLYAWFRRLTGHEADAADLTQKTFGNPPPSTRGARFMAMSD